ncbi:acyl-CoA synthetases/AMP-acid ligases II [Dactylonectria estremocensis]|uniref:Acyl-CoA synthetases/AMP-acid ligases II n=1 Tax=Dactylonectria estremocensis TaxID=1079267 RepID=A0A9P9JHV7_9HYPO|nr:acyl-CoA synthetases/AMP-acid ligases II [Dactylonectria estremocensis]
MAGHRIYNSRYPMPNVPTDQSVSQFLLQSDPDDAHSDRVILADSDNPERNVTYGQLRQNAARDAAVLRHDHGLQEADVVCIYAHNSVSWASLAHGVMWAGVCFCGINPLATSFELVHYFEVASPKIVAVDGGLVQNVIEALKHLTFAPTVMVIDDASAATAQGYPLYPQEFERSKIAPIEPLDLSLRDNRTQPAGMCFSSGTSGKPKGVVFSHHNLIAQLLSLRATNPFLHNGHMREVFFPSFSHVYGIVSAVLLPAWVGSYAQAMKRFDYTEYLKRCAKIRATVLRIVPAVAVRMVKDPDVRRLDLSCVQAAMCSGAPLSDDVVGGLQSLLAPNASVLNGFGMSEATITLLREMRRDKGASVGRPAAGVSIRVVDDNYNDVEPGTDGECLVKGPTMFMEYKANPAETRLAKQNGWLRSGDVVRVDDDGFFFLTGRKKELIKFKGNQIAPAELEAVLLLHPHVVDAGVCGVEDRQLDTEIPVGFVTLAGDVAPGQREDMLEDVRVFVNARVASYKVFRERLFHVDALPKNTSGKLLRRNLVAKATELRSRRQKL